MSDPSDSIIGRHGGGRLLAAISEPIVANVRGHYGRGPMKARTYVFDDGGGRRVSRGSVVTVS